MNLAQFANQLTIDPFFNIGLGILSQPGGNFAQALGRGVSQGLRNVQDIQSQRLGNQIRLAQLQQLQNPTAAPLKPTSDMQNLMAAGILPGSDLFRRIIIQKYQPSAGTTVNVNTSNTPALRGLEAEPYFYGWKDPKKGEYYRRDPGNPEPYVARIKDPGGASKEEKAAAHQVGINVNRAERMAAYENKSMSDDTYRSQMDSLIGAATEGGGALATSLRNAVTSSDYQEYLTDSGAFLTDHLRDVSGLDVTDKQRKVVKGYVVKQPFEHPESVKRKQLVRQEIMATMARKGSNSFTPEEAAAINNRVQQLSPQEINKISVPESVPVSAPIPSGGQVGITPEDQERILQMLRRQ